MSHEPRAKREYPFAECRYNGELVQVTTLSCGPKRTPEVALQKARACYMKFDAAASKEEVLQFKKLKQQETSEETVQADTVDPDIMAVLPEDAPAEHQAVIFFEL